MNRSLFSEEPSPISGQLPAPPAENSKLRNKPSPISGQSAVGQTPLVRAGPPGPAWRAHPCHTKRT